MKTTQMKLEIPLQNENIQALWRLFESSLNESVVLQENDFEPWNGGISPPMQDDVLIWKVLYRDGVCSTVTYPPSQCVWRHKRVANDIVGFLPLVYSAYGGGTEIENAEWIFNNAQDIPLPEKTRLWQVAIEEKLSPVYGDNAYCKRKMDSLRASGKVTAYRFVLN